MAIDQKQEQQKRRNGSLDNANQAINAARGALGAARTIANLAIPAPTYEKIIKIYIPIGVILLICIIALGSLLFGLPIGGNSFTVTPTIPTPSPIVPSPGTTTDISSCLFTRGDLTPSQGQYKSSLLLSYFEQASQASGVPASVLAGIARIESPGAVNYTDQSLSSFVCPVSPTGALGLMQIEPAGATG